MRTVHVLHTRSPFEMYLLGACIIAGLVGLVNPASGSSAILEILPRWELYLWYSGITAGGVIALGGLLGRRGTRLYTERAGLLLLIGSCVVYSTSIIIAGGTALALSALSVVAFGTACVVRVRQITRDIRIVRMAFDGR